MQIASFTKLVIYLVVAGLAAATSIAAFTISTKPSSPVSGKCGLEAREARMRLSALEQYRGANKWAGLIPRATDDERNPRTWNEGFRQFLLKYGMLNHVVYDVFIKGEGESAKTADGLKGTSRFKNDLNAFTQKGLEFSYVNKDGETKTEYDFSDEYHIIGNIVSSPRSFFTAEDNWFGFVALSNDEKELIVVFRGTETTKEWVENATLQMERLDGEKPESGLALLWNQQQLMVHSGFQQLYTQKPAASAESPQQTVRRLVEEHKGTLEAVTLVGHSLGGAMCQLAGVDLVHSGVLGNIPVTAIAWAAPKIGNAALAARVAALHPRLRVLRISNPIDIVTQEPPDWLWSITTGGYMHIGTELTLRNENLHKAGRVKADDGNSPNHNLEQYLHCIDTTRDVALMNKVGSVIPDIYCIQHNISPRWHSQTWPRTIYKP